MAADTKQNLKQLRVDNWAVFFLQRLQLLFAKGDCCDLTLKFVSGQELKVHRLVLSTSTSFFESMESKGNVIHLPESLPYSVVQPIINFLYSGRLEFKAELHSQLLAIAKIMKLAILARILVAQKNDNGVSSNVKGKFKDVKKVQLKTNQKSRTPPPSSSFANILAGKKLPIWKKRTVPYRFDRKPIKDEEPGPTRFEWPDEGSSSTMMMASPSFSSLSYESAPVISTPVPPAPSPPPSLPSTSLKRRVMPPVNSIPDKIFKPQEEVNATPPNNLNETTTHDDNQLPPNDTHVSDDDDDDDGHFETIHSYGDSDDDLDTPVESDTPISQLKPILKPMTDTPMQTPTKKVRFSFAPEDKENKDEKAVVDGEETPKASEKKDITNHAKIIQEVLKKYPQLVKNNKNIKLKITAPGSASKPRTVTVDTKKKTVQSKASYIVLKSSVKSDTVSPSSSELPEKSTPPKTVEEPLKCELCMSDNGEALQFESHSEHKKHLQEVHLDKIDSRICEHCGYKASKRNLHLYHLYTKHGVDPPKNVKFPKCSQCSYIALSESLLVKHLNSHQLAKDLTCQVCNTTFRTYSSLHVHGLSCKPNSEVRSYTCPNCKKAFKTNVSLNAHVKVCTPKEESDEGGGSQSSNIIEVPIIEAVEVDKDEHELVQIPSGIILAESPNVALLPSSESEALNNVASSIATSIGLTVAIPQEHQSTVILLNSGSQFFLQDSGSVVVSNDSDVEEYIVPELLRDEMGQIYSTQNVPYTVSSTGVITCPVMSIESANVDDKDKVVDENNSSSASINIDREEDGCREDEDKNGEEQLGNRTSLLESDDSHLESSNTRVEIRDSQTDLDIAQLERALMSPVMPTEDEDTAISNNESMEQEMEPNQNCQPGIDSTSNEMPDDVVNQEDNDQINLSGEQINDDDENNKEEELKGDDTIETPAKEGGSEKDKATSLVKDWGFDNEEDIEEDAEDSENRPTRPDF